MPSIAKAHHLPVAPVAIAPTASSHAGDVGLLPPRSDRRNSRRSTAGASGGGSPEPMKGEPMGGEELRVGDVARLTGKTVRALHLYEELGLVEPSLRSKGGFRLYNLDAVERVRWVGRLQDMGLSLPEIRDLLRDWRASGSAPKAMRRVRDLYQAKARETREQITKLRGLLAELEQSLAYLETCKTCEPDKPVSECALCDKHDCQSHKPTLVAGFQ